MLSDLANMAKEFVIDGKTYKVARLSIKEIFGTAEIEVLKAYSQQTKEMSSDLDAKEKFTFRQEAMDKAPKGQKLFELGSEWLSTPSGMANLLLMALNKLQEVSEAEIIQLILKYQAEILELYRFVTSTEIKKEDPAEKKQ